MTSIIQNISDTARWAAAFRAMESRRPDALFADPFAQRLAGPRGFEIANALSDENQGISWIVRTYLFDRLIASEIEAGAEVVINLGAGLDARPYRMNLPDSLQWFEVDAPEILAYKQEVLVGERPHCDLQRVGLDLLDRDKRSAFFSDINERGKKTLVLSEGVLVYLSSGEVSTLATDLAAHRHFCRWILEMVSPAVLHSMTITCERHLVETGVSFQFGPVEGPSFFERYGWKLVTAQSVLKNAIRLNRTPLQPDSQHLIPDVPPSDQNSVPWVGVCLFDSSTPDSSSLI